MTEAEHPQELCLFPGPLGHWAMQQQPEMNRGQLHGALAKQTSMGL